MIEAWRTSYALPLPPGAPEALKGKVFPSGRQALTEVVRRHGLTRKDRIAVPEWSSACVLSAVSASATPLLMTDLGLSATAPAGVLVDDQGLVVPWASRSHRATLA